MHRITKNEIITFTIKTHPLPIMQRQRATKVNLTGGLRPGAVFTKISSEPPNNTGILPSRLTLFEFVLEKTS